MSDEKSILVVLHLFYLEAAGTAQIYTKLFYQLENDIKTEFICSKIIFGLRDDFRKVFVYKQSFMNSKYTLCFEFEKYQKFKNKILIFLNNECKLKECCNERLVIFVKYPNVKEEVKVC